MDSPAEKGTPRRIKERNKAIAMTRAIDMISEEFIENFQQTGKDSGPEGQKKLSPVREALLAREKREAEENKPSAAKPEFKGFASLLAATDTKTKTSAFARLLVDDDAPAPTKPSTETMPVDPNQPQLTADGALIKVKDTVGKKRGLYTSCMQRPTEEQMQAMAEKYSRSAAKQAAGEPVRDYAQSAESTPAPAARPSSVRKPAARTTHHSLPQRAKMTCESTCPLSFAMGKIGQAISGVFSWLRGKFGAK